MPEALHIAPLCVNQNMNTYLPRLLAVILLTANGLATGQSVRYAADYFPLQVGATWTYRRTPGNDIVVAEVERRTVVNGVSTFQFDTGGGDLGYFTNDHHGLRLHRLDTLFPRSEVTFDPPIVQAGAVIEIGERIEGEGVATFRVPGSGRFELQYATSTVVTREEVVTVPAGTYESLRLDFSLRIFGNANGQAFDESETETLWLASGVGIVRDDLGPNGVLNLVETTVEPVDVYQISSHSSGLWFNPDQSGHGLVIQIIDTQEGERILVYWFVHQDGAQVWLGGVGDFEGDAAIVQLYITSGTGFPPDFDPEDVEQTPWGELTLIFMDDEHLEAGWATDQPGFTDGILSMSRLTRLGDPAVSTSCASGAFYNVDQSGHGILVEVVRQAGEDVLVMTWFVYVDGEQAWLQGTAPLINNRSQLDLLRPIGGDFPPRFDPATVELTPWGSATFEFEPPNNVRLSWEPDQAGFQSGFLDMSRLTVMSGHECATSKD